MTPRGLLIAYGTSYGQTAKIAHHVADLLTAYGYTSTLVDIGELPHHRDLPSGVTPHDYDGVIIGASVLFGRHQSSVRRFVLAHREALSAMPSAFLSVSGSAGSPVEGIRAGSRRYLEDFLRQTGWQPALTGSIAGALAYTRYPALVRWIVGCVARRSGWPTDTSRDHETTDWRQVREFADAFAAMLRVTLPRPEQAGALATGQSADGSGAPATVRTAPGGPVAGTVSRRRALRRPRAR